MLLIVLIAFTLFIGLGFVNYVRTTNGVSISEKVEGIKNKRSCVTHDEVSEELLQATVAIKGRHSYEHHGVGYRSIARVLYRDVLVGQTRGGGSAIAQQLAKDMYYTYQPPYPRKVSEIFTVYDLGRELSKREILELYVNVTNYGDNHIGIKAAGEGYLYKGPGDLTLGKTTLLAGLPRSPTNYQLSSHEFTARNRQIQVLNAMIRKNMIDEQQKATVMKRVER